MDTELKVISGLLFTKAGHMENGKVKLDFATNTVTGDGFVQTSGEDAQQIGPKAAFISEPCKVVSLRWMEVPEKGGGNFNLTDYYLDPGNRESIEISWEAPPNGKIREISYMFIGYARGKVIK